MKTMGSCRDIRGHLHVGGVCLRCDKKESRANVYMTSSDHGGGHHIRRQGKTDTVRALLEDEMRRKLEEVGGINIISTTATAPTWTFPVMRPDFNPATDTPVSRCMCARCGAPWTANGHNCTSPGGGYEIVGLGQQAAANQNNAKAGGLSQDLANYQAAMASVAQGFKASYLNATDAIPGLPEDET